MGIGVATDRPNGEYLNTHLRSVITDNIPGHPSIYTAPTFTKSLIISGIGMIYMLYR